MECYCETPESKGFRGTTREMLVTKLLKDIKQVLEVEATFPLQPTKTTKDLKHAHQLAKNRIYWKRTIVGAICSAAKAEKSLKQCLRSDTAKKKIKNIHNLFLISKQFIGSVN